METNPLKQKLTLSACCNASVSLNEYYTVEMMVNNKYPSMSCSNCKKECTPVFLPKFKEVGKGILRKIEY